VLTSGNFNKPAYQKTLGEHFEKQNRDDAVLTSLRDGYTQASIAKFLGVSRSLVCKIVKDK